MTGIKSVLVTGATGFLGRNVLPELIAGGWKVHAVSSRQVPERTDAVSNCADVVWHRADLLDPCQVNAVVSSARTSHLLHLAWYVPPRRYFTAPEHFVWVQASIELLRAFRQYGGVRIVTAGSCLEYDWNYGYCSEQRTPCVPHSVYGVCKHALQTLTSAFAAHHGLTSAWPRMFHLYGPYEHPDRLVPSVIRSLLAGELARCSHGEQIRDYLFAKDAAAAFLALLEASVTGPINIASGIAIRLKDIVQEIGVQLGRQDLIQLGAIPPASTDLPFVVADISRQTDVLQWRPRYDLATGLALTIEWSRNQITPLTPLVEQES
jgi:nucleoside-diphosphate-sugar epimerase